MFASLAFVFLFGLLGAAVFEKMGLPRIIGMLLVGVLIGPYALGLLDSTILAISGELRRLALMLILLRAGLSLDLGDLKRVGRPAVMMAFVPATFEVLAVVLLAPIILGVTRAEAAVMGAVLGAVSPAVVVPRMVRLMEEGRGVKQGVPQMVMAGASCDDVYVIVLFSTFTRMAQGGGARLSDFAAVPVSIVLGALCGAICGGLLHRLFERARVEQTMRIILTLAVGCLLIALEGWLDGRVALSGLLGVMGMAVALRRCGDVRPMAAGIGRLWQAAEVLLFVLVGAGCSCSSARRSISAIRWRPERARCC